MHPLQISIEVDAVNLLASKAVTSIILWSALDGRPGSDDARLACQTAASELRAASQRLRAVGGDPGPIISATIGAFGRVGPYGDLAAAMLMMCDPNLTTPTRWSTEAMEHA